MEGHWALWLAAGLLLLTAYGIVVAVGVLLNVAGVLLSLQDAARNADASAAEQESRLTRERQARTYRAPGNRAERRRTLRAVK